MEEENILIFLNVKKCVIILFLNHLEENLTKKLNGWIN